MHSTDLRWRLMNLLGVLLFWAFLVVDVFAACYWIGSKIAALLIGIQLLKADSALTFSLLTGALSTLGVFLGLISLVKRKSPLLLS